MGKRAANAFVMIAAEIPVLEGQIDGQCAFAGFDGSHHRTAIVAHLDMAFALQAQKDLAQRCGGHSAMPRQARPIKVMAGCKLGRQDAAIYNQDGPLHILAAALL